MRIVCKIKRIGLVIFLLTILTLLAACKNNSKGYSTVLLSDELAREAKEMSENDFSVIPENLYLSSDSSETFLVKGGLIIDESSYDKSVLQVVSKDYFGENVTVKETPATKVEAGHYYRIYSKYMDAFFCSQNHEKGIGLKMVKDPESAYTIWKAEKGESGFLFASDSGYLKITGQPNLTVDSEGSEFTVTKSRAENSEGSFGFTAYAGQYSYRIDCFDQDQISAYSDDGNLYPHTSFYLYEVDSTSIEYSEVVVSGLTMGTTNFIANDKACNVCVFNPSILEINLNPGEQYKTKGYNMTDEDMHDCGFFSYQCDLKSGGVTFFVERKGKALVKVGDLTYSVCSGLVDAVYDNKEYSSLTTAVAAAKESIDSKRTLNQIISLTDNQPLFDGTLPAGVLLKLPAKKGFKSEAVMLTYSAESDRQQIGAQAVVYPVKQGDSQYLYLPTTADYSNLNLHLPANTIISSKLSNKEIVVSKSDVSIDYTTMFGDMSQAGATFPLEISWKTDNGRILQNVTLIKSDNVSSLFFELEEEGIEDIVEWIQTNKLNKTAGGSAMYFSSDGKLVYDGEIDTFHMRGNSNLGDVSLKPGYGFKLSQKTALIGHTPAKSWCLVANSMEGRDSTNYATSIGYSLYLYMNNENDGDYAVEYAPVDLYINGEYRGMYILAEKVNADRINITTSTYIEEDEGTIICETDKSDPAIKAGITSYCYAANSVLEENAQGGYIIEICGFDDNTTCGFVSARGVPVEIKEPSAATKEQVQQIAIYYQSFEDALYSPYGINDSGIYYADYIDVESFAKLYVLKAFLEDPDLFWGSTYMYIDGNNAGFSSKLKCCAAWDFDGCKVIYSAGDEYIFEASVPSNTSASDYKWQLLRYKDFTDQIRRITNEDVFCDNTKSFCDIVEDMCSKEQFIDNFYDCMNNAMSMNKVRWTSCNWLNGETTSADLVKGRVLERLETWKQLWSEPSAIYGVPQKTIWGL